MLVTMRTADGWNGALVFSRNCYAGLERTFNWNALDRCGGFDSAAAVDVEDSDAAVEIMTWFQSEASAGRYLEAASKAGLAPSKADVRWSELTQLTPRRKHEAAPTELLDVGALPTEEGDENVMDY